MRRRLVRAAPLAIATLAIVLPAAHAQAPAPSPPHPGLVRIQADTPELRAEWDRRLARMLRSGALKVREERTATPNGPRDQWLDQLHKGVTVVGARVWRRLEGGTLTAAEGSVFEKITIDPVPKLTRAEARVAVTALAPGSAGPSRLPDLVVLPTQAGGYALVYRARVFSGTELVVHYLDASTGAVVLSEVEPAAPPPG